MSFKLDLASVYELNIRKQTRLCPSLGVSKNMLSDAPILGRVLCADENHSTAETELYAYYVI